MGVEVLNLSGLNFYKVYRRKALTVFDFFRDYFRGFYLRSSRLYFERMVQSVVFGGGVIGAVIEKFALIVIYTLVDGESFGIFSVLCLGISRPYRTCHGLGVGSLAVFYYRHNFKSASRIGLKCVYYAYISSLFEHELNFSRLRIVTVSGIYFEGVLFRFIGNYR